MFPSKYIATFIFMSLLHAASGSCCQHPPSDISKDNCHHVIGSKTEQPTSKGLQTVLIIPPNSCRIKITVHSSRNNTIVITSDSSKKIFGRIKERYVVKVHLAGAEFSYMRHQNRFCRGQCIYSKGTTNESVTVEILYADFVHPGVTFEFYEPKNNKSSSHHNHTQPSIYDVPQNQQPYPHNSELRRRYPPYGSQQYGWKNAGKHQHRGYDPPKNHSPVHTNISHATYYRRPRLPYHRPFPYNTRPYRRYLPGVLPIVSPNTESRQTSRENRTKTQLYNNWNRGLRHPVIIPSRNPVDYNRINYRHYPRIIPNRINNRHIYNPRINKQHFPRIPTRHDYKKPFLLGNRDLSVKQHPTFIDNSQKIHLQHSTVPEKRTHLIDESLNAVEFYEWKIAGFTECSRTCGGGIQQTRVVCVKIKSQVTVTAENCNNSTVPTKQKVTCNTGPCQPSWQTGNWSSCSTSCGPGSQTRTIECTQILSPSTTLKVSAERCSETPRPAAVRQCQNNPPCGKWLVKAWGKCKPECGQGSRRKRLVKCVSPHLGTSIPGRFCPKPKPHRTELCEAQHCPPKWYVSKWSNKCSSNCGSGFTTRQVICVSNDGDLLSSSRCDHEKKPEFKSPCSSSHPCGGIWFTGAWSECSADCGKGQRTREVACLKKFGINSLHVVSEENCQDEKPVTQESCVVTSCDTDWFLTEWGECSATCGEGQQTRQVKCFDKEFKPSTNCTEIPPKTRKCNIHSCRVPSASIDHSCIDRYGHKNCQLVMRARLCNNPVYKQKCCVTCSQQNSSLR